MREEVHTILGLSVLDTGSGINAGIPIEGDVVDVKCTEIGLKKVLDAK